jgi:hypothetical protein
VSPAGESGLSPVIIAVGQEHLVSIYWCPYGLELNEISGAPAGRDRALAEANLPDAPVLQHDVAAILDHFLYVKTEWEGDSIAALAAANRIGRPCG